jgi:hypothetical protein
MPHRFTDYVSLIYPTPSAAGPRRESGQPKQEPRSVVSTYSWGLRAQNHPARTLVLRGRLYGVCGHAKVAGFGGWLAKTQEEEHNERLNNLQHNAAALTRRNRECIEVTSPRREEF